MLYLDPTQIVVQPNRIRQSFDEDYIADLAGSITSKGLFHAITVRLGSTTAEYFLVAGENRLRACNNLIDFDVEFNYDGKKVPKGKIPCVLLTELPEDLRLEAELEENTHRRDLSWQEQVAARERLFQLRNKQATAAGESFSAAKLGEELRRSGVQGSSTKTVTNDLRVARHLSDPDVAGAKTQAEALKIVAKKQASRFLEALGEIEELEPTKVHTLVEGDCRKEVLSIPDGRFSIVLTDPPYGVDIQDAGSQVEATHHYEDTPANLHDILDVIPAQITRVTTEMAHLYWFCDIEWWPLIREKFEEEGWIVWPRPIIWNKNGKGIAPDTQFGPRNTYECILFARKGLRPTMKLGADLITVTPTSEHQQAEKPVELLVELLSRSAQPGDLIFDPFCGSGSIFVAATQAKCIALGMERDTERAKLARSRLSGEKL